MDTAALKALLRKHEGVRGKPYTDTVGKLTIGVGRNLDDVGLFPSEIDFLLDNDVRLVLGALSQQPWFAALDDIRKVAIADMAFMGVQKVLQFHNMIAALQAGDYNKAADEMLDSKWATQVGVRATELAAIVRKGAF